MGLFGGVKRELLGLDIGSYAIKAAFVVPSRSGLELQALASVRTPPGSIAVEDGVIIDIPAVAEAIRTLVRAAQVPVRDVATSVGGQRVIARPQTFPHMNEQRLRQAVLFDAEKFLAFPGEQAIIEPQVVTERNTDEGRMQDVMVVAAQSDTVESRSQAIQQAGLTPQLVDTEAFALMRSIVYGTTDPGLAARSIGIVRLGESYGDITIVAQGNYVLHRTLPGAGRSLTEAIARRLGIEYHQAEAIKEQAGIAATPDVVGRMGDRSREVFEAIEPILNDLIRELRLSLSFYQTQFQDLSGGGTIDQMLLTGGTAILRNLDRFLADAVGVPVIRAQHFDSLRVDTSRFDPAYVRAASPLCAVAMGLTLTNHMMQGAYPFATDPAQFGVALQRRQ